MKVLLVGAGGQGGPCASILSRDNEVTDIVLADVDLNAAQKVKDKIGSDKIRAVKVNAGDIDEITSTARGMDVIIDLVMPRFAHTIMQAALKVGSHYVNTAFSRDVWDDIEKDDKPRLYDEFKKSQLTALLGSGMAPGYLNVLTRLYADKLDTVSSIKCRLGKKNSAVSPLEEITKPWNPGWSPKQALLDCANPPYVYRNAKYELLGPYAEIEEWEFPKPLGLMLVSHHAHEEPYSMPKYFAEKGLEYCDFKYYVTAQAAALVSLGLASEEEVEMNGTKIKPIDLVEKIIPKAGKSFLNEDYDKLDYLDEIMHVVMMLEIKGKKEGKNMTYIITIPKMTAPGKKLYDLFGTSLINVALPAVIGAKMAVEGTKKGVIFSEELNPNRFLELFSATGHPNKWEELLLVNQ